MENQSSYVALGLKVWKAQIERADKLFGGLFTRIVDANPESLPRGSFVTIRGQLQTMRSSYLGLLGGLVQQGRFHPRGRATGTC